MIIVLGRHPLDDVLYNILVWQLVRKAIRWSLTWPTVKKKNIYNAIYNLSQQRIVSVKKGYHYSLHFLSDLVKIRFPFFFLSISDLI